MPSWISLYIQPIMQQAQQQIYLELNQNFDEVACMHRKATPSLPSPVQNINYVTFEQRGDGNYGRATFIAQFAPGAAFPPHVHDYGEEVFVIEGTLTDQFGEYPKGHYIRQAINSGHTPFSKDGTKLFVKMWQMPLTSNQKVLIDTKIAQYVSIHEGVSQTILFKSPIETVFLYKLTKGALFHSEPQPDVSEIFLIQGNIKIIENHLQTESWLRIPKGRAYDIQAVEDSLVYVKIGKGVVRGRNWEQVKID